MKLLTKLTLSTLLVTGVSLLSGCDEQDGSPELESNSGNHHAQNDITYLAQNTIRQTSLIDTYYVDLKKNMSASDGSATYLKDVMPLTENSDCQVLSTTSSGFTVSARTANACHYLYTVSGVEKAAKVMSMTSRSFVNPDGSGSATISVLAGGTAEVLNPISAVTSTSTPIDIAPIVEQATYGVTIDSGFALADVTIPTAGISKSKVTVNHGDQTITYTPGDDFKGVERVLYSFTDGSDIKMGTIDLAVSVSANTAPTADSFHYLHDGHYSVPSGQDEDIDVKKYVSDTDEGDDLQLIDVFTYDADVTIPKDANGDSNFYNDTQFTFFSNVPGSQSVTYVVTDNHGGYATGVISLTVDDIYPKIFVQVGALLDDGDDLLFSPPYTVNQAENAGVKYKAGPKGDDSVSLKGSMTAMHDWNSANGICMAKGGSLPAFSQLTYLYNDNVSGGIFKKHHWPLDKHYWTSDVGRSGTADTYQTIDLNNGSAEDIAHNQYNYVACISNEAIKVDVVGPAVVNIAPSLSDSSNGTAKYQLNSLAADGSDIATDAVNWDMTVSDSYFITSGTIELKPKDGSFNYYPDQNTDEKQGSVNINGCNKEHVCAKKAVSLTTCKDLAGKCIDIFSPEDDDNLFTSSPSVEYLNSIGGSPSDEVYTEKHSDGTPFGDFYIFSKENADKLCKTYNEKVLGGRTNWKLTSRKQLEDLGYKDMRALRDWPVRNGYWSTKNSLINLQDGSFGGTDDLSSRKAYVSCVSEAP
ncbi:DUF823 domain-containing adhesin [Aliivibrio sifiae]